MKNIINNILRFLQIKTTKCSPNINNSPKWCNYLGRTPEGSYFWLSNLSVVSSEKSNFYFPNAIKLKFTGFVGNKSDVGSITIINKGTIS